MRQQQIEQLIYEKRRRLQGLELKEARYGLNTPPEVYAEIEDLKVEIEALEDQRAKIVENRKPALQQAVPPPASESQPSLALTLSVEPERVAIDNEATWTVTIRNDGDDVLRHVTVIRGRTLLDAPFELTAGEERLFSFTTEAKTSGEHTETIAVTGVAGDGTGLRDEAGATVEVFEPVRPSLALDLVAEPEAVTVGSEVTWTVMIHNDGNDPLRSVIVRHGRLLLDDPFDLAIGAERQFTFATRPKTAGEQNETVTAGGMAGSGDRVRAEAGAAVQVRRPKAAKPKPTPEPVSGPVAKPATVEAPEPPTRDEKSKTSTPKLKTRDAKPDTLTISKPFKMEFVRIPAGDFLMGSDPTVDKDARDNEQPQHSVYLPDYYMAKTPVTNAQYAVFVKAAGYKAHSKWQGGTKFPTGGQIHPANYIRWPDAIAFCKWLTREGGYTVRLPTEAEWEKAARGTDGRIYPWGNQWDKSRLNCDAALLRGLASAFGVAKAGTTSVGHYSPKGDSPYGLVDMAGNVWEWCSTIWDERAYPFQVQDEWIDAYLSRTDVRRVLRGGSWGTYPQNARCACRSRNHGDYWDTRGFRVLVSPSF